MWLARDKKGNLTVHRKKPFLKGNGWWTSDKDALFIDNENEFPEVTFENSPMEIKSFKDACAKFIVSNMESEIVIHTETSKEMMDKWDKVFKEYNEKYENETLEETPERSIR